MKKVNEKDKEKMVVEGADGWDLPISGDNALDGCVDGVVGELDAETAGLAGVDVDGGGRSGDGQGREEGGEESGELHFKGCCFGGAEDRGAETVEDCSEDDTKGQVIMVCWLYTLLLAVWIQIVLLWNPFLRVILLPDSACLSSDSSYPSYSDLPSFRYAMHVQVHEAQYCLVIGNVCC